MRLALLAAVWALFCGLALAKTWGPATVTRGADQRIAALNEAFRDLAAAPNETASRIAVDRVWVLWMQAPDAETAEDMNRALRARGGYNFDKALGILNGMIKRHPDYAEPWNQRSYIHFLKQDFDKSLADCEKALELEPRHIGCMTGMARILIRHQGRFKAGENLLKKAIQLHPFVYEKVLLKEIPGEEL